MSRGLGRAERAILAELVKRDPEWPLRLNVLAHFTGLHPESLRRAMKSLAEKDLIELGWDNGWRVLESGAVLRFWETGAPTARLSADYLSTLSR
jgi:hypothetical protein